MHPEHCNCILENECCNCIFFAIEYPELSAARIRHCSARVTVQRRRTRVLAGRLPVLPRL